MKQQEAMVDSGQQESKLEKLLSKLVKPSRTRNGYKAVCPAHYERTPSLIINIEDGKILLKCFGQDCKAQEIVDKLGLTMSDLFEESGEKIKMKPAVSKGKKYNSIEEIKENFKTLEDAYEYNWLGEEPSYLQIRYLDKNGDKQFATYHKDGESWYAGKGDGLTPLYNLDGIKDSKAVLIVEGEKVVKLLKQYGIPATTSLGGSNAAEWADWTALMNKPSVVMWRDNDEAGIKYQHSVNSILSNIGIGLRKVEVEKLGLEKGDDLEEYIAMQTGDIGHIRGKIYSCLPRVETIKPVSYLKSYLDKVKKGDIKNWKVEFFPILTKSVRMFKPGTQSVLVSAGGVGKSLFIGRTSDEFVLGGVARVKRLMLESPMSFHLSRSLAQQSRMIDVMSEEFHHEHPDWSDEIVAKYEDVLNQIGDTITTSDSGLKKQISEWTTQTVCTWMEQNAPHADLLVIDPVSIVLGTYKSVWEDSIILTKKAEELMSKYPNLSVVWIQHTAESSSDGNVGGISGGKAWNRYTSAIIEMVMLNEPEMYEIEKADKTTTITQEVKTFMKIRKARNGEGNGWKIAIDLDGSDLTYKEVGRMTRKVKS